MTMIITTTAAKFTRVKEAWNHGRIKLNEILSVFYEQLLWLAVHRSAVEWLVVRLHPPPSFGVFILIYTRIFFVSVCVRVGKVKALLWWETIPALCFLVAVANMSETHNFSCNNQPPLGNTIPYSIVTRMTSDLWHGTISTGFMTFYSLLCPRVFLLFVPPYLWRISFFYSFLSFFLFWNSCVNDRVHWYSNAILSLITQVHTKKSHNHYRSLRKSALIHYSDYL